MLRAAWHRVLAGEEVTIRPRGGSMAPLIMSGDTVTVSPLDDKQRLALRKGDIVLVRVRGAVYLHKVTATDMTRRRVQIGNSHGGINGWTALADVAGKMTGRE